MKTLKDINWNQVYCFYEVARKLSMKEAGILLGVSTPTVSEQIKKLEQLLDITLFRRQPRKIELTHEGEALFNCAKEIFEAGGRFLDNVSPDSIGGYSVRVGIQETMSTTIAIDFVNQYWDLFAPFGTVNTVREVFYETLIEKLSNGRFDWCISLEKPNSSKIDYQEVAAAELVFCCSPRIFKMFKKQEDILRSIPVAMSSWDTSVNRTIQDAFREANVFPGEIIESDHNPLIITLAQRGRCVAIFPEETVRTTSWGKSLVTFKLSRPVMTHLYALWPKGSEKMVSIKKLLNLLSMTSRPDVMQDPDLQIKVGEVKSSLLE